MDVITSRFDKSKYKGKFRNCLTCKKEFYAIPAQVKRNEGFYCSRTCASKNRDNTLRLGKYALKGCLAPVTCFKRKDKRLMGKNNPNWKDGNSLERYQIIHSSEYKDWRNLVFKRDNYTCQFCGQRGGKLNADHIYPQGLYPEYRFKIDNGRTLCKKCHEKTFTYLNSHLEKTDFGGITGDFAFKLNVLPVDEVSDAEHKFKMWDSGGVECEVGEFLYGLIRISKPTFVLETGCYHGWSSSYIGAGLKENNYGHLITLEIESQHIQTSKERWTKLGLQEWITVNQISSLEYTPEFKFDLMFLDSEPQLRFQEVIRYFPNLKQGGFMFIHDLHPGMSQTGQELNGVMNWPYGTIPEEIKNLIKDGELVKWHFRTPRGLTGFYKPGLDDYRP